VLVIARPMESIRNSGPITDVNKVNEVTDKFRLEYGGDLLFPISILYCKLSDEAVLLIMRS
jgi:hypothetical protein